MGGEGRGQSRELLLLRILHSGTLLKNVFQTTQILNDRPDNLFVTGV